MSKSYLDEAEEQRGAIPACTGARLRIKEVEKTKTKEKGLRMYVPSFVVVEPKQLKGMELRDWLVVGTEADPLAKRPETWKRSEGGPGRLKRLLARSGTPLSEDDEEWMEAAVDNEVIAPIIDNGPDADGPRNKVGLFFRESDEDCPVIGIDEDEGKKGKGSGKKQKGAAAAAKRLRSRGDDDEDEDEDEEDTGSKGKGKQADKPKDDDDEDDEPKAKKGKKASKSDDDEDDDEKPAKGKKKKPADDDDDDE